MGTLREPRDWGGACARHFPMGPAQWFTAFPRTRPMMRVKTWRSMELSSTMRTRTMKPQ